LFFFLKKKKKETHRFVDLISFNLFSCSFRCCAITCEKLQKKKKKKKKKNSFRPLWRRRRKVCFIDFLHFYCFDDDIDLFFFLLFLCSCRREDIWLEEQEQVKESAAENRANQIGSEPHGQRSDEEGGREKGRRRREAHGGHLQGAERCADGKAR
jgi:hypothetical protein